MASSSVSTWSFTEMSRPALPDAAEKRSHGDGVAAIEVAFVRRDRRASPTSAARCPQAAGADQPSSADRASRAEA